MEIVLKDIGKYYGRQKVLKGISFFISMSEDWQYC